MRVIRQMSAATTNTVRRKSAIAALPTKEKIIVCCVFAVTGSSAVAIVRPALRFLVANEFGGLPADSGFMNGPWLYRCLYFAIMWPSYTILLYTIGTLAGRQTFFANFVVKMWGRVLPKGATQSLRKVLKAE